MSYFNTEKVRPTIHPLKTIEVYRHKTSQILTQAKTCINYHNERVFGCICCCYPSLVFMFIYQLQNDNNILNTYNHCSNVLVPKITTSFSSLFSFFFKPLH